MSTPSERLIARLRVFGILRKNVPVELIRTPGNRGMSRAQWQWHARNPVTKESYHVGSRYSMRDLLKAAQLATEPYGKGVSVVIPGVTLTVTSSKQDEFRVYSCDDCGALPGKYCLVGGRASSKTIHRSRIGKYSQDH